MYRFGYIGLRYPGGGGGGGSYYKALLGRSTRDVVIILQAAL